MTLWTIVALMILSLILGIGAWFLFMWAVRNGQFDDIEGPKYRIFDDDFRPENESEQTADEKKRKLHQNEIY